MRPRDAGFVLLALLLVAAAPPTPAPRIEASVHGYVPALSQGRKSRGCWATAAAMLLSWKLGRTVRPEEAAAMAGPRFVTAWTKNTGLSGDDKVTFLRRIHLVTEAPQDFSIEGWRDLVRDYGPLWVTTQQASNVHGRIVERISGDASGDGTFVFVIDPEGGVRRKESLIRLTQDFDNVAISDMAANVPFRAQIVHFCPDESAPTKLYGC